MKHTNTIKSIHMGRTCQQDWSAMNGDHVSRNCRACDQSVFDLSKLSPQEVINFLERRSGQDTCARIHASQIATINSSVDQHDSTGTFIPLLMATTLSTALSCSVSKQATVPCHVSQGAHYEIVSSVDNPDTTSMVLIIGHVFDNFQQPLAGAVLATDGNIQGCATDLEGRFEWTIEKEKLKSQSVTVHYLGYEKLHIPLSDIRDKQVTIGLEESGNLLGSIVVVVQVPRWKRIWYKFKGFFYR